MFTMETSELTSAAFWESEQCQVMVNDRDGEALAEAAIIRPWAQTQPALSGHVLFATSGSSGGRKWVALSREALLASARMVNDHLSANADDRWLMALPDFHVGGLGILARCHEAFCKVLRLAGKWDPVRYHELALAEGSTLSSLVPTQLFDLVEHGLMAPESLRAVIIGGGRLDDQLYEQALQLGWPLMESYGMTEAASQVATSMLGSRDLQILPAWQTRISEEGCLSIKGESLLSAYIRCDGDSCEISDPIVDGWYDTGDLVELRSKEIIVRGRADRCVKVLGELVNLAEVENRIIKLAMESKIPAEGMVVLALPDDRKGNRFVLCSENQIDGQALLNDYNSRAHALEQIEQVFLLDEIPRSPLGKVLYSTLAEAVANH